MQPPWVVTPENEAEYGPYADYLAWEEWISTQEVFEYVGGDDILSQLEKLDYKAKIALYVICCRIASRSSR